MRVARASLLVVCVLLAGCGRISFDARSDGGVSDAGVRFCALAPHVFCADFEDEPVESGWTDTLIELGGSILLVAATPTTSAHARMALPRHDVTGRAQLLHRITTAWRPFLLDFDFLVEQPSFALGDSTTGVVCLNFGGDAGTDGACMSFAEDYTAVFGPDEGPIPYDTWIHLRVSFDPDAATVAGEIGSIVFANPLPLPPRTGVEFIQLEIGALGFNAPAPATVIRFDNVTLDPR